MPNISPTKQTPYQEKEFTENETPSFEIKEKISEILPEKTMETLKESEAESKAVQEGTAKKPEILEPSSSVSTKIIKSQTLKEIEDILEEDLQEVYFNLPQDKQMELKKGGEEVASKIEIVLKEVKIKVSQILNLIKNWLKIIPGVNKFFLEQEAKIKTDKIIKLSNKEKNQTKELDVDDLV